MYVRQLFLILGEERIPCYMETVQLSSSFFAKMLEEKLDFEILLFLDTFCNTNVSDFGTF